ncbi:MAG TPA: hypothetical protein DCW90_18910 [Lachnospiraceae bacterium]|nr:hypothetical protein [Lachnospiraceae bacterium]
MKVGEITKKVISSILSLFIVLGSVNISFAAETSKTETRNIQPTQKTIESQTKEDIEAQLKEKYSDIMEQNPCMKTAFKEVTMFSENPNYVEITFKLEQLKGEKESLLAYKRIILKNSDSKDEVLGKQLKNINNRLQAIEYTETYLTKIKKFEDKLIRKKDASYFVFVTWSIIIISGLLTFLSGALRYNTLNP